MSSLNIFESLITSHIAQVTPVVIDNLNVGYLLSSGACNLVGECYALY